MERFHAAKKEKTPSQEMFSDWRELKSESEAEVQRIIGSDFDIKTKSELEKCTAEEMRSLYVRAKELLPVIRDELVRLDVTVAPDNALPANNQDRFKVAALASYQNFCEMILDSENQDTSATFAAYYPPRELGFGSSSAV